MATSTHKILAVAGGFYFFGQEVQAPEGFVALRNGAMFNGFAGDAGVAGVARGAKDATVKLNRFADDEELIFPLSAVYAIMPSIDLYSFKGATLL